ncbi:hypothetical protein RJ639_031937 [Escallonia herrerae]|uniref:Eukaryotic translation initiation factor 3 subunit G N-terminal domain-containing protein n=1 Tax=Escallonia herrerae TaxID=1293975 RepID=A0AA88X024_9ASTE|nr:hypothetical protein RJ639_031937 [Escallonia herrerae]
MDTGFLLPPPQVIGPDSNGIKKVITYKLNREGKTVKITTTSQVRKLATMRVVKRALERRNLTKHNLKVRIMLKNKGTSGAMDQELAEGN